MTRAIFVCVLLATSSAFLAAQQTSQSSPYQGVSTPPTNDAIVDEAPPQPKPPATQIAKPHASHYATPQTSQPPAHYVAGQVGSAGQPPAHYVAGQGTASGQTADRPAPGQVAPDFVTSDGTDGGIVIVPPTTQQAPPQAQAQPEPAQQAQLQTRPVQQPSQNTVLANLYASDPDGDIVHPHPLPPGQLGYGTIICVRLLHELASGVNQPGDTFRSQVVDNVLQDGRVLIPAGSEIDGRVVRVSSGDGLGSSGYMDLRPDTVILPSGKRYRMYAMVSGTAGSHTSVGAEGTVRPGSQLKRDGIDYGAGVGAGAATGAIIAGPVGALTGSVVGAALITAHLLTSHPQATLDRNSMLTFTLTEPLDLVAETQTGE